MARKLPSRKPGYLYLFEVVGNTFSKSTKRTEHINPSNSDPAASPDTMFRTLNSKYQPSSDSKNHYRVPRSPHTATPPINTWLEHKKKGCWINSASYPSPFGLNHERDRFVPFPMNSELSISLSWAPNHYFLNWNVPSIHEGPFYRLSVHSKLMFNPSEKFYRNTLVDLYCETEMYVTHNS